MSHLLSKFVIRIGECRRTREIVTTLALSLCKLRGEPALSKPELDAVMAAAVLGMRGGTAATSVAKCDYLIACLDGLILERRASRRR